jgi:hypothetical protein
MLLGIPRSARCVQRFDDSLNSAIHITFRTFAAFFIDAKAKRSVVESCFFRGSVELKGDMHYETGVCVEDGRDIRSLEGEDAPHRKCTGV